MLRSREKVLKSLTGWPATVIKSAGVTPLHRARGVQTSHARADRSARVTRPYRARRTLSRVCACTRTTAILLGLAGALLATLVQIPAAGALISPVTPIDGPSSEIVELGGVAMAADGSGGIVYRKRVEGRPHIYAALYSGGHWGAPQRVDTGQQFESSFPAIAAGEGGRLVVVWVNHYSSTTDGLFSAALEPGSTGFQPPVPVDLDLGQAIGTYPSVAMNLAGNALVAYRVVTAVSGPSTPEIPPGYVDAEIRMARFDGEYWSSFGLALN